LFVFGSIGKSKNLGSMISISAVADKFTTAGTFHTLKIHPSKQVFSIPVETPEIEIVPDVL
jgi:hypothetical protein